METTERESPVGWVARHGCLLEHSHLPVWNVLGKLRAYGRRVGRRESLKRRRPEAVSGRREESHATSERRR